MRRHVAHMARSLRISSQGPAEVAITKVCFQLDVALSQVWSSNSQLSCHVEVVEDGTPKVQDGVDPLQRQKADTAQLIP